jgi:hypothetical protein
MSRGAAQGRRRAPSNLFTGRGGHVRVKRVSESGGIGRRSDAIELNATEQLVLVVLDDEFVLAQEIAGSAGITIGQCRRALGTLREKRLAVAERSGQSNRWKRA